MQIPVFSLGDDSYTWQDVVAHARATGDWSDLERAALEGAACEAFADAGEPEPEEQVEQAAEEFRYERDLVTAAEMEAWLAERSLSAGDWMAHIRRTVLRAAWADRLDAIVAEHAPDDETLAEAVRGDLRSTGVDRHLAERLAHDLVAALSVSPAGASVRTLASGDVIERAARFRASVASDEAIHREVAAAHLDWIRLDCRAVAFGDENEAREAALCLRDDGLDLDEVAGDASVEPEDVVLYVGDIESATRPLFLSAQVGEVIGPIVVDGAHALYQVVAKTLPTAEDPDIVARAREAVLERTLASEVNRRVRWNAQFQA